jgi:hypothetical protein
MTKSDDELGDLLRETFAEKENQVDHLPEAIKSPERASRDRDSRRFTPVLAGAAAIVIVFAGAIVVRQNLPQPTNFPAPAATTTSSPERAAVKPIVITEDMVIWANAIAGIVEREPGAKTYYVLDAPQENENGVRGKPFTLFEKSAIAALVGPTKVEWITKRPALADACAPDAGGPYVTVGSIVHSAGHVEVDASIWRGCLAGRWLTFRLDEKAGDWKVTGTVGPEAIS